jgi:hypothetical protein
MNIAYYKNKKYRFGAEYNGLHNLCSLEVDKNFIPLFIIKGIEKKDIEYAYRAVKWIKAKDCTALFERFKDGKVILNVRPSEDVNVLQAKQVDRGVYHAEISIDQIQRIWEEREPYLDFPFPEGLDKEVDLIIDDIKTHAS